MSAFYEVGKYTCEITGQALTTAGTGTPQFMLQFKVLGLTDLDDPTKYIRARAQYTRTFYRAITDKTIPYFIEDLQSLGYVHGSYRFLDPKTEGFQDFTGNYIDMWCAHEEGRDGDDREKWSIARTTGPTAAKKLEAKPLEASKVRELDNLFGKHLKGNGKPAGEKQTITPGDVGKLPPPISAPPPSRATDDRPDFSDDDSVPF